LRFAKRTADASRSKPFYTAATKGCQCPSCAQTLHDIFTATDEPSFRPIALAWSSIPSTAR
jgi:hypothetical protein